MINYNTLITHYSKTNKNNKEDHLRVDWPNYNDLQKRYENMINSIPANLDSQKKIEILDLGCGLSGLFLYLKKKKT